ncbi:unnamed protein product [Nezara viridula]|nr:unnamed protein product [Nezara viridula]
MTETKTFAQKRLMKMIESYKQAKKHKNANSTPSLKGQQQSGYDANKKTSSKRDTNARAVFAPGRVKEKNNSSVLKSSNKNQFSSGGVGCQKVDSFKNVALSQQSLEIRKPQNLSLERSLKKPTSNKCFLHADTNPIPLSSKEAGLKRQNKLSGNREKHQETFCRTAEKRPSDHENLGRKKIMKNEKFEDSSKNIVNEKSKNDPSKVTEANTLKAKLSLIVDSYATLGNDSSQSKNETQNKTEKSYQAKEPYFIIRKNVKFSTTHKKDTDLKIKDKEREIKDTEKMKPQPFSSPKTKLQARLQKVKADMKDKQKRTRKESSCDKMDVISKDDSSNFIESMDWEPSNDLILRSIRDEVDPRKEMMEWQDICDSGYNISREICGNSLYLVVDTNVLIRNIELIKKLSKAVIRGFKIIQVIPWQVLKELDNLKTKVNYENVNISARKVIRFLSEATNSDQSNVVFQSQSKHFEECHTQFIVEVPDDHLIKCCYQFKEKSHKVLLLSNDVNLRVKTNTNNIQAVDSNWIANILNQESKSRKQPIHVFEEEPKDGQRGRDDDTCQFAHKTTRVMLSSLYNIVLLKYKEKYGDLWPLWVPKEPHFPDLINFMTSNVYFQSYWIKLNSIKDFFIKNKSYDNVKPGDIEKLGRNFVSLLKSICSDNFIPNDLAMQFFKELGFLKCFPILDWSDSNYIEGSYRLGQKYLKDTEDSLNEFV